MFVLALLLGCRKNDEPLADLPNYRGEWLLPLVQGDAALVQLSQLQELPLSVALNSGEFGFPAGTYPVVPPIALPFIGPFDIEVADFLVVMEVSTMDVTIEFNNPFPIPINEGTRIVLRNEPLPFDPGNIILNVPVTPQLAPGGSFTYNSTVTNIAITDTLYLYLEDFSSPGGTNVTFEPEASTIDITLARIEVDRMEVLTGRSFERMDSLEINIDAALQDQTDIATGEIIVYADNGLPLEAFFQCYLYDAEGVLLDSLFEERLIVEGGTTDATGATTTTVTTTDTIPIDAVILDRFLRSTKAVISYGVSTAGYPGPSVSANAVAALRLQLVGDIRLNVAYSDIE